MYDFKEEDWKLFRKKVPVWQERFMTSLVEEYSRILDEDILGSDRFWKLKDRMDEDVKKKGVLIDDMSRSKMVRNLIALIEEGAVTLDELDGFSSELVETVTDVINEIEEERSPS